MGGSSSTIHSYNGAKKMNFVLTEMTFLRYFIPLIRDSKEPCRIFVKGNQKYNNPLLPSSQGCLSKLSEEYKFDMFHIEEVGKYPGLTFVIEGCGMGHLDEKHKVVSLTYQTDFSAGGEYEKYIEKVKFVAMPSRYFAEHFNKVSEKDIYFGSPKYDIELDKEKVHKKYNLNSDKKKVLILAPRVRDIGKIDLQKIMNTLISDLGYHILIKTRGKDKSVVNLNEWKKADNHFAHPNGNIQFFVDASWHPHTTMELMHVSDIVVNFDSTAIKEAVMLRRPVVNFSIKPFNLVLPFLYNYDYCKMISPSFRKEDFIEAVRYLTTNNFTKEFDEAIANHLFEPKGVSKKILDFCETL